MTNPLASSGLLMIYQGDSYDADETRGIVFSLTGASSLVSAASATLLLSWSTDSLSVTGAITNAGQATQTVTVELTAAQTAALPLAGIEYALTAVLASTHVETLARGRVHVVPSLPAN